MDNDLDASTALLEQSLLDSGTWGGQSLEAVEAAEAVASGRVPKKPPPPPHYNQETAKDLNKILRTERTKTRSIVRERAAALLERNLAARRCAQSLQYVPFSDRLIEAPPSLRESLLLLTARILLLHVTTGWTVSTSAKHRKALSIWARSFLEQCRQILKIECSPAMAPLFDYFKMISHNTNETFAAEDTNNLADMRNPQPVKCSLLSQCDAFLKSECLSIFTQAIKPTTQKKLESVTEETRYPPLDVASVFTVEEPLSHPSPSQSDTEIQSLETEADPPPVINLSQLKEVMTREIVVPEEPPSVASIVLRDFLMLLLLSRHYDAQVFATFDKLSHSLDVHHLALIINIQDSFFDQITSSMRQERRESPRTRNVRRMKVAGVAVGLGAITALTAGFAAPAIAAGVGALGIAGTSGAVSFLASAGGSAAVASIFGAGTVGLSGWKYSKRIGKIKVFEFDLIRSSATSSENQSIRPLTSSESANLSGTEEFTDEKKTQNVDSNRRSTSSSSSSPKIQSFENTESLTQDVIAPALTVTICISGWLRELADIWKPWRGMTMRPSDVYALRWEPAILLDLGDLVFTMLSQKFAITAAQIWLQTTIAGALTTALMWPVALVQYASSLDNSWLACKERALQAGKLLADALCDRKTIGMRPVTLMGFSMGARVIQACLLELHKREVFNVVGDVVLLGTPTTCNKTPWQKAREVVTGRLINCYSKTDWLLGFLFRYMEWGVTVSGVSPVSVEGVENYDISGIVHSHNQYADRLLDVLAYVQYDAKDY